MCFVMGLKALGVKYYYFVSCLKSKWKCLGIFFIKKLINTFILSDMNCKTNTKMNAKIPLFVNKYLTSKSVTFLN